MENLTELNVYICFLTGFCRSVKLSSTFGLPLGLPGKTLKSLSSGNKEFAETVP